MKELNQYITLKKFKRLLSGLTNSNNRKIRPRQILLVLMKKSVFASHDDLFVQMSITEIISLIDLPLIFPESIFLCKFFNVNCSN